MAAARRRVSRSRARGTGRLSWQESARDRPPLMAAARWRVSRSRAPGWRRRSAVGAGGRGVSPATREPLAALQPASRGARGSARRPGPVSPTLRDTAGHLLANPARPGPQTGVHVSSSRPSCQPVVRITDPAGRPNYTRADRGRTPRDRGRVSSYSPATARQENSPINGLHITATLS